MSQWSRDRPVLSFSFERTVRFSRGYPLCDTPARTAHGLHSLYFQNNSVSLSKVLNTDT